MLLVRFCFMNQYTYIYTNIHLYVYVHAHVCIILIDNHDHVFEVSNACLSASPPRCFSPEVRGSAVAGIPNEGDSGAPQEGDEEESKGQE